MINWYLGFAGSLLVLIGAVICAVALSVGKARGGRTLTPFHLLFAGVFLSVFVCMLPIYGKLLEGTTNHALKTVAFSLHNTLQVFTIDVDREIISDAAVCPVAWLTAYYSAFLSVAFVAAPIFTFGFVLSLFRNVSANVRYLLRYFSDVYVFSELNAKSLALGADVRRNHRRALIVYANVSGNDGEAASEQTERARALRAILFKKDVLSVSLKAHGRRTQMILFAIGEDEAENVRQSLKLIERLRERDNTRLFVFSSQIDSELMLTQANKGKLRVRHVNDVRSLVYRFLYEQGERLFTHALPMPDGDRKISAVIVGLGQLGTELLKALSWYCQMDGYRLEIDAFDADERAEDRFCAAAPELMSDRYNGAAIPGEAEYTIRIHAGVEAGTKSFADEIAKLVDTTCAFVSLGSDVRNIAAAVELRMLFERMGIAPEIRSVVYSAEERTALNGAVNFCGQPYRIEFIGDTESSYSEAVIMESELEAAALRRHMKWGNEEEFWQYEYHYRSSVASAIHMKARIACGIPGADKNEEDLTGEERATVERLEHRRWNAYMRAEGYICSRSPDKSSRNDLAKMHPDLVDYSALADDEKRKDGRVGTL